MNTESLYAGLEREGCDVKGAIRRMLGDEALYLHLLEAFYQERTWEELQKALERKDYEAAFQTAHLIKGSTATLGLTSIYEAVSRIVEKLRSDSLALMNGEISMDVWDPDFQEFESRIRRFMKIYESCH